MRTGVAASCVMVGIMWIGLGLGSVAAAVPPTVAQTEVEYLLSTVDSSGCEFYRNGDWFDSHKASAHLRYKYNALAAMGRFATAMDFIEKAATKSSISGRPYLVRCAGGKPVTTNQWLLELLERYRHCASASTPCSSWLRHDEQGIDHSSSNRPVSRLS